MKIKRLLDALEGIAALIGAAGSKNAATDVRAIKGLLERDPERNVDDALNDLRQLLNSEKRLVAANYGKKLLEAATDKSTFDAVHSALEKDKSVDKETADAIAHDYINTAGDSNARKSWPNRKQAIVAIRKKFEERVYQEGKIRIVEKYKLT
jgi:hypothetical protein